MIKVGINGFGRIGKGLLRMIFENKDSNIQVVAIKDFNTSNVSDEEFVKNIAYLLQNDSIYGPFPYPITIDGHNLIINNQIIPIFLKRDIHSVDWNSLDCNVLIEASGAIKNIDHVRECLGEKVKKIIITRGVSDVDFTMVRGVNENEYDVNEHNVISTSTCTGNAFAPIASFLEKYYGIENGILATIHPVLSNEKMMDGFNSSFQLGRAAKSVKLIETGIVSSTVAVLPKLKNKLMESGLSYRIPTDIVSSVYSTLLLSKSIKRETLIEDLRQEIDGRLGGVVALCDGMFGHSKVSIDYLKDSHSAIIDEKWIDVNKNLLRMHIWHDNEYGYCRRVYESISQIF